MFKKTMSIVLALALVFSLSMPVLAAETSPNDIFSSELTISKNDQAFLNKVISVADYWYIDTSTNLLEISLSETQLKQQFNFTDEEYERLTSQVIGTYVKQDGSPAVTPYFYIQDGALYVEYGDLVGGVFSALYVAAQVGPAAMAAAITSLSSMLGGPVGTLLGLALGLSAADLCLRVIYAVSNGKGIYFKPVLEYPLIEIDYF